MGVEFYAMETYISQPLNMKIFEEITRERLCQHKVDAKAHLRKTAWSVYRVTASRTWLAKNFLLNCFPRRAMVN